MERRSFLKGIAVLGVCPLCAGGAVAAEGAHWSYEGHAGPEHWGELDKANAACSAGSQQSPLDISGATKAEIPAIVTEWKAGAATIVNNGHTIQVNMPAGSRLVRGDKAFDLLQFHFHAPSEHHVEGKSFAMEAHFVHKHAESGGLGVLGVFLVPGAANAAFAALAAAFPASEGEAPLAAADPAGLLPADLGYWTYAGSLTTPPCSEVVEWMVAKAPVEVAEADIEKFTALYAMNARPVLPANRRFILSSG
jgi:carbonic anhydrase